MAATANKPDLDEKLDWGSGWEDGGVAAGGLRELVYRFDDWRIDRKAARYERKVRRAPRRRPSHLYDAATLCPRC